MASTAAPSRRRHASLLLFAALLAVLIPACKGEVSDEDRIRAAIKDMAAGAEAKDVGRVKGHVSKGYKDPAGNDYDALKGVMAVYFMQPESIRVFLRKTDVELKDGRGYATVRAVISRGREDGSAAGLLPSEAGGFVFDMTFEKEDGDWLLSSAIWRQVGVGEAL